MSLTIIYLVRRDSRSGVVANRMLQKYKMKVFWAGGDDLLPAQQLLDCWRGEGEQRVEGRHRPWSWVGIALLGFAHMVWS